MQKFSKTILLAIAVAMLSWFLPWLYTLLTPSPSAEPFCCLSPLEPRWIVSRSNPGEKPDITLTDAFPTSDSEEVKISTATRDSLVPQLYYRQLLAHDLLPDSINGKEISAHTLKTHEVFFTSSPRDLNKRSAGIWLMMESMPVRVDLSDPDEGFRITSDGIEFIRMADNSVNPDRSNRFTKAMKARGFQFPAVDLSANITAQKAYDEGYLMVDAAGKVFHVKQQAGRPYVAAIAMPDGMTASKTFIWEQSDKSLLGMVIDTGNRPYIIKADSHIALPLPADGYDGTIDPRRESVTLMGSLFSIIIRYSGPDGSRWRAYDADTLELIGAIDFPRLPSAAIKIARFIFPYTLALTSNYDSLAYPRLDNLSWKALPLNIILAFLLLTLGIRRKNPWMKWGALFTVSLGIYSFIAFLLLHD